MNQHAQRQHIQARQRARRVAMQALYQWQLTDDHPKDILSQYDGDSELRQADFEYFRTLLLGVPARVKELDPALERHTDKRMPEVDPVERAILRIAAYELLYQPDLPPAIILSEAVALTRKFGATEAHRFVNALLDKLAAEVRDALSARR